MGKFSIRSILLGIGIGIILTSIFSLIYFAGSYPSGEPSKAEVARLAEKYGLIEAVRNDSGSGTIFTNETTIEDSSAK